ncbi:hypothetical protein L2E82_20117 [Cichorium intybus]|uniref:Uncharacterized protein n=1 Tax=Cichorium intybus TaxID=13427 RepID=A0ACB9DSQ0_CICIN|nr:hypothetical protein L2E82_20117 [Cichorium intybus]
MKWEQIFKGLETQRGEPNIRSPTRRLPPVTVNIYKQRMGEKKKSATIFIRLVSAAGTGFFYVKKKNPRKIQTKLEFRKYDPRVNRHVLFTEAKMK